MDQFTHGTEDQLEAYALGQLSDSEEQVLEEHLLVCGVCRKSVDQNILYGAAMREALLEPAPERDWLAWLRPVFAPAAGPRLALAGALAALVLAVGLYFGLSDRVHYQPVVALQLAAIRGVTPSVEPARELDLTLSSFPAAGAPFKLQIVDANGNQVWSGETSAPSVSVHRKFSPDAYFVRLYDASGGLLHEYGFRVEQERK